jgi:hypothetical protein
MWMAFYIYTFIQTRTVYRDVHCTANLYMYSSKQTSHTIHRFDLCHHSVCHSHLFRTKRTSTSKLNNIYFTSCHCWNSLNIKLYFREMEIYIVVHTVLVNCYLPLTFISNHPYEHPSEYSYFFY